MVNINSWLGQLAHNYLLIVIAAIVFLGIKSILGVLTYRHYNKELRHLHQKVDLLLKKFPKE
ncbi:MULTISPECIES: hypothetical protein [Bacillales]|uniref:hypothetical protein n=1 Tax=Bacillales TaxID=1385 RepID=UPI0001789F81|nr:MULTISPECIES: hypothetical protein [Paenibacillus]ACX65689.1 hypothetical protein GYMC10_3452 [Paenibacillus sp. Y412MC10]EGG36706.1 hypothetical protein HMPREF9412_5852 [Paenibacillus sp. HGF5]ETT66936.1 hypothetical protein C172_07589 [Paenibacillus sp. FSL H8-457]MCM3258159.1 hypothetical protein [Paenibacillus lautus]